MKNMLIFISKMAITMAFLSVISHCYSLEEKSIVCIAGILSFILMIKSSKRYYTCQNCGTIFQAHILYLLMPRRPADLSHSEYYVKCPVCKKRRWILPRTENTVYLKWFYISSCIFILSFTLYILAGH